MDYGCTERLEKKRCLKLETEGREYNRITCCYSGCQGKCETPIVKLMMMMMQINVTQVVLHSVLK